ncbi:MAG: peptidase M75, partial [Myxococcales bacterium]|nr:peptidase M75 [Myxococcales bacterium]
MTKLPALALLGAASLIATACDSNEAATTSGFDDAQVVADFADHVIIPTYAALAERATTLRVAVDALAADPTEARLGAAQDAWVAARMPWEQSEAFLFGPVDAEGFDPALDTWPLNKTDLDAVLASSDTIDSAYVKNLPPTQKGFHTLEYLLFGTGGGRVVADLDARSLAYLGAVAGEFEDITARLHDAWTDGIGGAGPYRDVFVTAGAGSAAYPSLAAAAQEIVAGMSGICDEVANGKIADPYDGQDAQLEESRFSNNSLADFQDNIRSVKNAYLGTTPFSAGTGASLSGWVQGEDAALDTQIRAQIDASIA